mmetsp:Transcript_34131/g.80583  ORF Transcript_34131/g.80583 Transcript_34131/m.80583 type:complete len:263 (-) Transcript_34131:85-873(-)
MARPLRAQGCLRAADAGGLRAAGRAARHLVLQDGARDAGLRHQPAAAVRGHLRHPRRAPGGGRAQRRRRPGRARGRACRRPGGATARAAHQGAQPRQGRLLGLAQDGTQGTRGGGRAGRRARFPLHPRPRAAVGLEPAAVPRAPSHALLPRAAGHPRRATHVVACGSAHPGLCQPAQAQRLPLAPLARGGQWLLRLRRRGPGAHGRDAQLRGVRPRRPLALQAQRGPPAGGGGHLAARGGLPCGARHAVREGAGLATLRREA